MQQVCNIADAERFFGNADIWWVRYLLLKHCIIATAGQWRNATSWIKTYIMWRCNCINRTLSCLFWSWDNKKVKKGKTNNRDGKLFVSKKKNKWYLRMIYYLEYVKIIE